MSEKTDTLALLVRACLNLHISAANGKSALDQRAFSRMETPCVGDFVIETTTAYLWLRDRNDDWNGAGILVSAQVEGVVYKVWHIKTLSGKIVRWDNAHFIAAHPIDFDWYDFNSLK